MSNVFKLVPYGENTSWGENRSKYKIIDTRLKKDNIIARFATSNNSWMVTLEYDAEKLGTELCNFLNDYIDNPNIKPEDYLSYDYSFNKKDKCSNKKSCSNCGYSQDLYDCDGFKLFGIRCGKLDIIIDESDYNRAKNCVKFEELKE